MALYNVFINFNSVLVLGNDFCNLMSFSPFRQEFPAKPDLPTTRDGFCRPPKAGIHVSEVELF